MDIEAHLLPIEQQIWKQNVDIVTQLLSSRAMASMAGIQKRTMSSRRTIKQPPHIDSWQKIYNDMKTQRSQGFDKQEPIPPFMTPPWREGPATHIDTQTRAVHTGPSTVSTVYAAELQGISLVLQIAEQCMEAGGKRREIAIYTYNQAAIWSVAKAEGRSGAYILQEIASQVRRLQDMGRWVTVRWCKIQAERAWAAKWKAETSNLQTFTSADKKVLKLHENLSKRENALVVQMRTEKIGLNDFLFNRKMAEVVSARCECGERRQTAAHILLRCRIYKDLRN
ncbi:RNasehypothetical proteinH domain containing protein [Bipolaris maydis]|nr:RNasehypothetical proteinH domain containing protein [Bipolaris maydis]